MRTFRHCQRRRPLLLQNVQADTPISINVGVVNLRLESNFRRLERVINREGDFEEENATRVRRLALQTSKGVARTGKAGLDPGAMRLDSAAERRIQVGETYGTHYGGGPDEHVGLIGRTGATGCRGVAVDVVVLLWVGIGCVWSVGGVRGHGSPEIGCKRRPRRQTVASSLATDPRLSSRVVVEEVVSTLVMRLRAISRVRGEDSDRRRRRVRCD